MDDSSKYIIERYDKAFDELIKSSRQTSRGYIVVSLSLIACLFAVALLWHFDNKKWIDVFNSYEYAVETVTCEQDSADVNSFNMGEMGDIINGSEVDNYTQDDDKKDTAEKGN